MAEGKIKVGIIGPGNIGTDLMYKVMKSKHLQMDFMTGIVESEGLTRARELGFVDEIIGDNGLFNSRPLTIHNGVAKILSDEVKNKIRASVKNPELSDMTDEDLLMQRNKLNLLRMRGEIKHV